MISIIIPIYNEQDSIDGTIESILQLINNNEKDIDIILINDGSTDSTFSFLKKYDQHESITIINRKKNRGYGYSIKEGILSSKADKVFITDADGSYPIELIPQFINEIVDYDMVIGERTGKEVRIGFFNRFAKYILKIIIYILTNMWIKDLNSGFRIFNRSLIEKYWALIPDGFSLTTTLTVSALINNENVKFIPINYHKRVGKSKIRPIRDFSAFVLLIFRIVNYFNPLRFYLPISFLFLFLALARSLRDIYIVNGIGTLAVMLFLVSIQAFFFGLLADLIIKKVKGKM